MDAVRRIWIRNFVIRDSNCVQLEKISVFVNKTIERSGFWVYNKYRMMLHKKKDKIQEEKTNGTIYVS